MAVDLIEAGRPLWPGPEPRGGAGHAVAGPAIVPATSGVTSSAPCVIR